MRFHEVDVLRVVWHGHYLVYFEEARTAFGREYSLSYTDILKAGYLAPLVHVEVDYAAPARLGDMLTVVARLHPDEAARLNFTYFVRDGEGRELATGNSVQVFTDTGGQLVLTQPEFYREFLRRSSSRMSES